MKSRVSCLSWALLVALCLNIVGSDGATADDAVLKQIRVDKGICVVLGDAENKLAVQLAERSELLIYVQSPVAEDVARARKVADAAGLLGTRIYVERGDWKRIHLADNVADAAIVSGPVADNAGLRAEVLRVLRPGAKALFGDSELVKGEPKRSDDWSHPYHGPDNNPQSQDEIARAPFLTQFLAEPWYATMPQMSVVSGGRIFKVFGNRASARPQWAVSDSLVCLSARNGTMLWTRALTRDFMQHRNTLIATPETLYFADDKSCKLIDPATGKVRDEILVPPGMSDGPVWKWLALEDGLLYALVGEKEAAAKSNRGDRFRGAGWPWWGISNYAFGYGRTLMAIDPRTKKIVWHHREDERIDSRGTCMKNGRIYYFSDGKFLACLDAKKGKPVWKNSDSELLEAIGAHGKAQNPFLGFASTVYAKCSDDAIFFAGPMRKDLAAASTKDGKLLWRRENHGNSQLVLREDALYALGGGRTNSANSSLKLNPLSGKVLAQFRSRDRCTRATGCVNAIFTRGGRGGSTAVFDVTLDKPEISVVSPMRPACQDGVLVAHGNLYWGPWKCRCDYTQIGVIALAHGGDLGYASEATNQQRLESVVTDATKVADFELTPQDWPAYRKDNVRSTRIDRDIAASVKQLWQFTPPSPHVATAPVTGGDLVIVSGADGAIRALDASTGSPRWTAHTSGPLKYPPALWQGRAYAGSGDGWVYCFTAATGRQLWRFRAAPVERKTLIHGSLTSTWPVAGGALVEDGLVYAAAGMFNYDGTHVYALDARTGQIRWQNNTCGHRQAEDSSSGVSAQGNLLLLGDRLYMPGGNLAPVATFDIKDGKCGRGGGGFGKDLYAVGRQVFAGGTPLYWRPEDYHHIQQIRFATPTGMIAAKDGKISRYPSGARPKGKPQPSYERAPFQDVAAILIAKNAILLAGTDWRRKGDEQTDDLRPVSGITALDLKTGTPLWKHSLPAAPVSFALAVDRDGRILISMQDGRVICFAPDEA